MNYYTEDDLGETEIFRDCLTISTRGEYSGTVTYHEGAFCLANNILTMPLKGWSQKANLYFATLVQKLGYGGYSGYPTKTTLSKDIILLPTKDNQIDFTYMENYIRVLEEERIRVLETYLKASKLDTYELTKEEECVLNKLHNKRINFKKFDITGKDGIFDVQNTHSIIQSSIVPNSGKYPYVTAGESNNSVATYISYNADMLEKGNSIVIGGKTLVITYQEHDYFSNDSHNLALYLRKKAVSSQREQMFLISMLYKSLKPKYTWGDSISKKKIQTESFYLPVTRKNKIDYNLMEMYIKAIEKKVIQDVIRWKDKEIEKTKEVVVFK